MHERPILLTGATGYIGSRLLRELEAGGYAVRCLARQPARVTTSRATTEVVSGDCLDTASLDAAMKGVDQAFYLVHSMASGANFAGGMLPSISTTFSTPGIASAAELSRDLTLPPTTGGRAITAYFCPGSLTSAP